MALHHARAAEVVDFSPQGSRLRSMRTAAIVKTVEFEVARLVVQEGVLLKRHQVPGSITLYCLEGHVEIELDRESIEMEADEWIYLDGGTPHAVRGLTDSALLLTIILANPAEER